VARVRVSDLVRMFVSLGQGSELQGPLGMAHQ
jgi:hypothetical protein